MSVSYSECLILEAIKTIFSDAVQTHRFAWLVSPKGFQSEVDIFIPSLNLAIEYDGFAFHNSPKNHTADQFKAYQISNNGMSLLHIREENLPVLLSRKGMTVLEVSSDYSDQAMQEKCAAILSQVNYPT